MSKKVINGKIVDLFERRIFPGKIVVDRGRIVSIEKSDKVADHFVMPGFIDAHVHIESSMLVPSEFAREVIRHGTVATVSDPHEIANVLGVEGVLYMIQNAAEIPFKFNFGAPSCVPATEYETSGGSIGKQEIEELLSLKEIKFLSEVMDFPNVIKGAELVMDKIKAAKLSCKPVDGHAPGLRGTGLDKYIGAGISTDHECTTWEEALEKLNKGMKIQIREGSAAKNMKELIGLIVNHPEAIMLCTDDIHPAELSRGHISGMVRYGLTQGLDLFDLVRAATVNPVKHYGLDTGLLRTGDAADFILVEDLQNFNILATYINGEQVYANGEVTMNKPRIMPINRFHATRIGPGDIAVPEGPGKIRVIVAEEDKLITGSEISTPRTGGGLILSDNERDILKIVVLDRYTGRPPSIGFISGFGLKKGAIAGSVSHDCHNIIAVGNGDEDICRAVNKVIECQGALVSASGEEMKFLPLPVAGLMSDQDAEFVSRQFEAVETMAFEMGSRMRSPFMTLSFMALLVIPELKLSDRGLFDSRSFCFTSLGA